MAASSPIFDILAIPEIAGLDSRASLIRIPPEIDVPLTPRVRKIIDAAEFRRLADISQLGIVSLVYPGARHTRFEHSLGVYRLALLFIRRLANDPRFSQIVTTQDAVVLIAAALLHDIGHWPCCHLIEDLGLPGIKDHESIAARFVTEGRIAEILRNDWNINPQDIIILLENEKEKVFPRADEPDSEYQRRKKAYHLFMSILSGPIDIDKMDYLLRDSIGCGVPYGKNFDQERLIGSLCLNEAGDGLAIIDKGRTAAELMVFARYVMFSEVYWHHTIRGATVMYQRAFELLYSLPCSEETDLVGTALSNSFETWLARLHAVGAAAGKSEALPPETRFAATEGLRLLDGLFTTKRVIYKQVRQFSVMESPEIFRLLAGQKYSRLRAVTDTFIRRLNRNGGLSFPIGPNDILIDSPPAAKEIEFKIEVYFAREKKYRQLHEVSPVIRALAAEQFDHSVKKVRLFARPEIAEKIKSLPDLDIILTQAAQE